MLQFLSKYGQELNIAEEDCYRISELDSQKGTGKAIFGGGFLLSEKAAAEKAAAEVWTLSDREREIIKSLGKSGQREQNRSDKVIEVKDAT